MKYSFELINTIKQPQNLWKHDDFNPLDSWGGAHCPRTLHIQRFFESFGFNYLGHGHGRIGIDLNNGFVLKIPRNEQGVKQNYREASSAKSKDYYARCKLLGDSLVMVKVETLREKLFGTSSLEILKKDLISKITKDGIDIPGLKKILSIDNDALQIGVHPKTGKLLIYDFAGRFVEMNRVKMVPVKDTGKTIVWAVRDKNNHDLGAIRWDRAWKAYSFFPVDAIYGADDLKDIADFINVENEKRRQKRIAIK